MCFAAVIYGVGTWPPTKRQIENNNAKYRLLRQKRETKITCTRSQTKIFDIIERKWLKWKWTGNVQKEQTIVSDQIVYRDIDSRDVKLPSR